MASTAAARLQSHRLHVLRFSLTLFTRFTDQTPPRTEYRRGDPAYKGKNLMDLQFTPSTALYIKFERPSPGSSTSPAPSSISIDDLNWTHTSPPPLTADLLAAAAELPLPPSFLPGEESPTSDPPGESEEARKKREKEEKMKRLLGKGLGMGGSKGSVKPSWLKIGKDARELFASLQSTRCARTHPVFPLLDK